MTEESNIVAEDEVITQTAGDGSEVIIPNEKVGVNTLFIEVATGLYPVSLYMIIEKFKPMNMSFSMTPPRVDIENLGYGVVMPMQRPEGNVVTEGVPKLVNGQWEQTWVVRDYNESELAAQLEYAKITANDNIMAVRNDDFQLGMTYTVGDKTFNVQLRVEDRVNLMGMYIIGKEMVEANIEQLEEFRSFENESIMLTPQQSVDLAKAAMAAVKAIYKTTWTLKDQVDAATTVAAIPVIPSTFIPA